MRALPAQDPREYLATLRDLQALPEARQRFAIDNMLKRYERALANLLRAGPCAALVVEPASRDADVRARRQTLRRTVQETRPSRSVCSTVSATVCTSRACGCCGTSRRGPRCEPRCTVHGGWVANLMARGCEELALRAQAIWSAFGDYLRDETRHDEAALGTAGLCLCAGLGGSRSRARPPSPGACTAQRTCAASGARTPWPSLTRRATGAWCSAWPPRREWRPRSAPRWRVGRQVCPTAVGT